VNLEKSRHHEQPYSFLTIIISPQRNRKGLKEEKKKKAPFDIYRFNANIIKKEALQESDLSCSGINALHPSTNIQFLHLLEAATPISSSTLQTIQFHSHSSSMNSRINK